MGIEFVIEIPEDEQQSVKVKGKIGFPSPIGLFDSIGMTQGHSVYIRDISEGNSEIIFGRNVVREKLIKSLNQYGFDIID